MLVTMRTKPQLTYDPSGISANNPILLAPRPILVQQHQQDKIILFKVQVAIGHLPSASIFLNSELLGHTANRS